MTVGKDVSPLFPGGCCGCWLRYCSWPPCCTRLLREGSSAPTSADFQPLHSMHHSPCCLPCPPTCPTARPPCADVINQMQTDDMELKKLVYLYLINYAKVGCLSCCGRLAGLQLFVVG